MVELIFEIASPAGLPLAHQRAGSDGELVGRGADHGMRVHPVGMPAQIGLAAIVGAVALQGGHEVAFRKTVFFTEHGIGHLTLAIVTDQRADAAVEKCSVLDQLRYADFIFKAPGMAPDRVMHGSAFARLQRRIEMIDPVKEFAIVFAERCPGNFDGGVVIEIQRKVDFAERLRIRVVNDLRRLHHHVAGLGIDVDFVIDAAGAGLRQLIELRVSFFVIGLAAFQIFRTDISVNDLGVVEQPPAHGHEGQQTDRSGGLPSPGEAHAGVAQTVAKAVLSASGPEHGGRDGQKAAEDQPVECVPVQGRAERQILVKIGVGDRGAAAISEQIRGDIHRAPRQSVGRHKDDVEKIADVFVG